MYRRCATSAALGCRPAGRQGERAGSTPAVDGPDLVAAGGGHGTDSSVQTYDERIKATHQRARQRKLITVSPDSLPEAIETQGGFAPVVAVAFKPTFTPALDDTNRVAVLTMADPQHRIGVGKATKPLGWSAGTALVATCAGGRVTVSAVPRSSPAQQSVTLDSKGRFGPDAPVLTVAAAQYTAAVRAELERRGWSIARLARETGITASWASRMLRGLAWADMDAVVRIEQVLQVSFSPRTVRDPIQLN